MGCSGLPNAYFQLVFNTLPPFFNFRQVFTWSREKNSKKRSNNFNPNKGDVREALPGAGGPLGHPSFSALESPKGQKSCFHISLDHFQLILAFFRIFFPQITKKNAKIENVLKIAKKWAKFQNFAIFDLHQHMIHQKKAFFM